MTVGTNEIVSTFFCKNEIQEAINKIRWAITHEIVFEQ